MRLGWFRKAEELGNVEAACCYYGIPGRTYCYWHARWLASGKLLTNREHHMATLKKPMSAETSNYRESQAVRNSVRLMKHIVYSYKIIMTTQA